MTPTSWELPADPWGGQSQETTKNLTQVGTIWKRVNGRSLHLMSLLGRNESRSFCRCKGLNSHLSLIQRPEGYSDRCKTWNSENWIRLLYLCFPYSTIGSSQCRQLWPIRYIKTRRAPLNLFLGSSRPGATRLRVPHWLSPPVLLGSFISPHSLRFIPHLMPRGRFLILLQVRTAWKI